MTIRPHSIFDAPGRAVVLPVIHIASVEHAVAEALLAFKVGARGLFLINHDGDRSMTMAAAAVVHRELQATSEEFPWVGVNLLGVRPPRAFHRARSQGNGAVSGVWVDQDGLDDPPRLQDALRELPERRPMLFAGLGFKHQPERYDLETTARAMRAVGVDVLTTSGPATGLPCDPEKVRRIRAVMGPKGRVAVASGVTPENAAELVEAGADALLVATGIGRDFHHLDPAKLERLLAVVASSRRGTGGGTP